MLWDAIPQQPRGRSRSPQLRLSPAGAARNRRSSGDWGGCARDQPNEGLPSVEDRISLHI